MEREKNPKANLNGSGKKILQKLRSRPALRLFLALFGSNRSLERFTCFLISVFISLTFPFSVQRDCVLFLFFLLFVSPHSFLYVLIFVTFPPKKHVVAVNKIIGGWEITIAPVIVRKAAGDRRRLLTCLTNGCKETLMVFFRCVAEREREKKHPAIM